MRWLALALVFGGCAVAGPAAAQLAPYKTSECFAFWKLKQKLDHDGVGKIVAAGPQGPDGGIPLAQFERVALYLDLEEKLRFRCPEFAPPPDKAPGKRQTDNAPVVTAKPENAVPASTAQPQAQPAPAAVPTPQGGPPIPVRRPPKP
jgi:hypothetical protein